MRHFPTYLEVKRLIYIETHPHAPTTDTLMSGYYWSVCVGIAYYESMTAGRDYRISNQFLITRALHFAKPQAYYQAASLSHWVAEYNLKVSS